MRPQKHSSFWTRLERRDRVASAVTVSADHGGTQPGSGPAAESKNGQPDSPRQGWELALLPLTVLVVSWPQYGGPVQYNEAMFVVFGREILLGGLPYRDVFDQKPPLIYYLYAASEALFGDGFMAPRILIFASMGATAVLVALTAREFLGRRLAFVAGGAFALSTGLIAIAENAGLDQLMLLPLMGAVYVVVVRWMRTRTSGLLVVAGVLASLALLLKPVALPVALVLGGIVIVTSRRSGPPLVFAGTAATCGLATLLVIWLLGVLPEASDAVVDFGREYGAYGWANSDPGHRLIFWLLALSPLVAPAGVAIVILTLERSRRVVVLGALLVASIVGVVLPGVFLPYYAWLACPFLALVAPVVFEWMGRQGRMWRLAVLLPGAFVCTLGTYVAFALPSEMSAGDVVGDINAVGEAIRTRAVEGDRLWVRANLPQVYYIAGLRPAHRYFTPQAIAIRPTAAAEVAQAFDAEPPAFIVMDVTDAQARVAFAEILDLRYEPLIESGRLTAYSRRD